MAKLWITEYEVVGQGPFPVDMLRYDASYPIKDAGGILQEAGFGMRGAVSEPRRVRLHHRETHARWEPTVGRWNSFGWEVDQNSVRNWSI